MSNYRYTGIEGFVTDLKCTVRECIDCGCLVPGGPTRCKRCAKEVDGDKTINILSDICDVLHIAPTEDPLAAILAEIVRLQEVSTLWTVARQIARMHCPVGLGFSYVRDGIPKLAARADKMQDQIDQVSSILKGDA